MFSDVLILTIEELSEHPKTTLKKVYKFLDVDESFESEKTSKKFNVGGNYTANFFTKLLFQPSGLKNTVKKFIKPTPFVKIILMRLASIFNIKPAKIDESLIIDLKQNFREDVANLKKLDIDMSNWKDY